MACALGLAAVFAVPAHAGLFDDDEARRAILDLRKQLEQSNEQARTRQAEQMSAMSTQLDQLKRSLLELNSTIELQRSDNAKLRGQIEQLTRDVAELQRKQTDVLQGVDDRLRKVEPQKVTVDDREFTVDPDEKRALRRRADELPQRRLRPGRRRLCRAAEALSGHRLPAGGAVLARQRAIRAACLPGRDRHLPEPRGHHAGQPARAGGDARHRQLPGRAEGPEGCAQDDRRAGEDLSRNRKRRRRARNGWRR